MVASAPLFFFFNVLFVYFLERRREGERERQKHQCVVASHAPPTGDLAFNPGMCPRLGIEPATLWFPGRHSVHWATPARVASAPEQIHSSLRRRKRAVLLGTIASLSVCHKLLYSGGFQTYLALSHRKKYILHTLLTCIQQKEKFRKQHLDLQHTIHSDIFCSFYFISLKKKKVRP